MFGCYAAINVKTFNSTQSVLLNRLLPWDFITVNTILFNKMTFQQVDEGQRFEMSARISGEPQPTVKWLKDGVDVSSNADYIATYLNSTASLCIEETLVEDSGIYTVKAESPAGHVESSATLIVKCMQNINTCEYYLTCTKDAKSVFRKCSVVGRHG